MAEHLDLKLCPYLLIEDPQKSCGGCQVHINQLTNHFEQSIIQFKQNFISHFDKLPIIKAINPSPPPGRDRMDFQLSYGAMGFFSQIGHQLIPIKDCLLLSPKLRQLFKKFITLPAPTDLDKISIRLRVGPQQQVGIWIDTSHQNTIILFDQHQNWLKELSQLGYVEWGQQRKQLAFDETGRPKLTKKNLYLPTLFATYLGKQEFPLQLHVGDFTQPSRELNQLILAQIDQWLYSIPHKNKLHEFGCGIGNFTFALSRHFKQILAYELDPYQSEAFKTNYQNLLNLKSGFTPFIELITTDARQAKNISTACNVASANDWVFLNPSRSGVGDFIKQVSISQEGGLIYLSCYPESFLVDMKKLSSKLTCQEIVIINQFPLSSHIEILSLWKALP